MFPFRRLQCKPAFLSPTRLLGSLLPLLWLATAAPADGAGLSFRIEGRPVKEVSREALLQALPTKTLTVENPANAQVVTYQGMDLLDLLNLAFGAEWRHYELVKFHSRDGYQPVIPRDILLAHRGLVAYREQGKDDLPPIQGHRGETIELGPYFLVWDNRTDAGAKTEPWLSWPWQLVAIELTRPELAFPKTTPPPAASDEAKRGFTAFLQHCIKCHQINGEGGDIGPELNYPVNVTEYWQADWLPRFIADPKAVRQNARMVGFYPGIQNREAIIRDIVSYLQAMAGRKLAQSP